MNKADEIEKAEKALKEASERLGNLTAYVAKLESELYVLKNIEETLKENITILKSEDIIAVASEFKRSKEELTKIQQRIAVTNIDKANNERSIAKIQKTMIECREALAQAMLVPLAPILEGNFRSKNGQKRNTKKDT
jgi:chromosome segregation ATPase